MRLKGIITAAGLIAGLFGLMNIFARTLGGVFGDRFGIRFGLKGRVLFLGAVLALEGLALILFSQMASLLLAVGAGGNAGAVAAGFLFRIEGLSTEQALLYLGIGVALVAPVALLVRFSPVTEMEEKKAMELALSVAGLVPSDRMSPATAD